MIENPIRKKLQTKFEKFQPDRLVISSIDTSNDHIPILRLLQENTPSGNMDLHVDFVKLVAELRLAQRHLLGKM